MTTAPILRRDLTSPHAMAVKAALFLLIVVLCAVLLVSRQTVPPSAHAPDLASVAFTLLIYALGCWCACRAYYFAFYVITAYCDPAFRYAGVLSALRWVLCHRRGLRTADHPTN